MTARNHLPIALAILCGFSVAFALLLTLTVFTPLAGQLLPGGNLMVIDAAAQAETFRRATLSLSSFWFWCATAVLGMFCTLEIWKWMRG